MFGHIDSDKAILLLLLILSTSLAEGSMESISAKEVINRIIEGDSLNFDKCIIQGDLIANHFLQNKTHVKSEINIINCEIKGIVDLSAVIFEKPVTFYNTTFDKNAFFTNSQFYGDASFIKANFQAVSSFTGAEFHGDSSFAEANFGASTAFMNSTFNKTADFIEAELEQCNFQNAEFREGVNFNHCIIYGLSNFNRATFNAYKGTSSFWNSSFMNSAYFEESVFKGEAQFYSTKFNKYTSFNNAIFGGSSESGSPAKFTDCRFNEMVTFDSTTFNGPSDFTGGSCKDEDCFVEFKGGADFTSARFNKGANFQKAQFNGSAVFNSAKFIKQALFTKTKFKDISFYGKETVFQKDAAFVEAEFNGLANFAKANFIALADFTKTKFNRLAYFEKTKFNGETIFDDAVFYNKAIFNSANFSGNYVSFNSSQFREDALFEETIFHVQKIYFQQLKYGKLYLRWSSIKDALSYDNAVFLSLIDNFIKLGYVEDADNSYYVYRKKHRDEEWDLETTSGWLSEVDEQFRKKIDWLLEHLYGYGVDPLRPFYYSILVIFCFSFTWLYIGRFSLQSKLEDLCQERDCQGKVILRKIKENFSFFREYFLFSLKVFLAGTRLFIDPPEMPKNLQRSKWSNRIYFFERLLGAMLFGLLFLAVSRSIIR